MPPKITRKTQVGPAIDSKMTQGYEISCRGQYYADNKKLRMYEMTFFIPKEVEIQVKWQWKWFKSGKSKIKRSVPLYEKVNGRENAQYIIQRLLLPSQLADKYPDAVSPKTCIIGNVKLATRSADEYSDLTKKDILTMTRPELKQFCALHSLATDLSAFSDVADARIAVKDSYDEIKTASTKTPLGPDDDLEEADDLDKIDGSIDEDPTAGPGDGESVEDDLLT